MATTSDPDPASAPIPDFETTFSVPLSCQSCIDSVKSALEASLPAGSVSSITASLSDQLVSITGHAAPSSIVRAIEERTGKEAILRGSGKEGSAGVCILETHASHISDAENGAVRGLVRLVEVGDGVIVADVGIQGVTAGAGPRTFAVMVREAGDISRGAASVGGLWEAGSGKGRFGSVEVGADGRGSGFLEKRGVRIWEMIGRSMVVCPEGKAEEGMLEKEDEDTLVGVVARSAGVWGNDKMVCSCSGKTVWEERREQRGKGML